MPKVQSNVLELVDSESEDDLWATKPTSQHPKNAAMPAAKKPRGRPATAANKVTKPAPKSSARRTSGRLVAAIESPEGRAALAEKSSNRQPTLAVKSRRGATAKDAPLEDEPAEPSPPAKAPAKAKAPRGRPRKAAQEEVNHEEPEVVKPAAKRGRKKAVSEKEEAEIPETQQAELEPELSVMDLDLEESEEVEDLPMHDSPDVTLDPLPASRPPPSATRRAPTSLPSSFDDGDPSLRRRLGDLTKKHETLETRYRNLRDVAVREAERNFDRLKKQSEEKATVANQLIASLKAEVAAQKELARDGQKLKVQLDTSESRVDALQAKVTELTNCVAGSKTEIKALNMKLTASRTAEASAAAKVPGSALKNGRPNDVIHQAAQMHMKEDLYADLTGLIVRGVKKDDGEDVFDCLQTGRNGTLHFKLAIENDTTSDSYDQAQYLYMPQLDPSRDRELIDLLPDFLVEEITFPRPHAAKFYARVIKSLNERPEDE